MNSVSISHRRRRAPLRSLRAGSDESGLGVHPTDSPVRRILSGRPGALAGLGPSAAQRHQPDERRHFLGDCARNCPGRGSIVAGREHVLLHRQRAPVRGTARGHSGARERRPEQHDLRHGWRELRAGRIGHRIRALDRGFSQTGTRWMPTWSSTTATSTPRSRRPT